MGKTLIYNARIVGAPSLPPLTSGWVLVEDDRIAALGAGEPADSLRIGTDTMDAAGAMLLPGLIDSHVHFREPGLTHKGTIASESAAAVLGGVTSFIEMPNTVPATTDEAAFADKLERAKGTSAANYGFMLGAADGVMTALGDIDRQLGADLLPAVKLFMGTTTGGMAMPRPDQLDQMLSYCADSGIPVVVHAEDNAIIADNTAAAIARYGSAEAVPLSEHSSIRSAEACLSCARQAIDMALSSGARLHLAHVSTAAEAALLQGGTPEGKLITAETTPMYLDGEFCDPEKRTWRHKINPAVKSDAMELRRALADGLIDTIATDHAPHLPSEKGGGALKAASGAPSVQFALPVMLEYLAPETIVEKMAVNPAAIFGVMKRGKIEEGFYADLVLVEKCSRHIIADTDVASPCGWTPFKGHAVYNRVAFVWVNGKIAVANGSLTGTAAGQPLRFAHKQGKQNQ